MNRRNFLRGCASFTAMSATRGFGITELAFGAQNAPGVATSPQTPPPNNRDLLVFVFVRGGMDGLNMVMPHSEAAGRTAYHNTLRPTLAIPAPDDLVATRKSFALDANFAIHPDMARGMSGVNVPNPHAADSGGLAKLFADGDLAVVHATGSLDVTGSHFDTQDYVEAAGTGYTSGWITRYLQAVGEAPDALALAPQSRVPRSLSQWYSAVAVASPSTFGGAWRPGRGYENTVIADQRGLLLPMFQNGAGFVESMGVNAFAAYDMLAPALTGAYTPAVPYMTENAFVPDGGTFGRSLQTIARLAKSSALSANPLRVACVDVGGGWDTHDNEGTVDWAANNRFPKLVTNLSTNLKSFHDDMSADAAWHGRFTVIVVSEFGRVMYQNSSGGCDHGSGNVFYVMGSHGNVNGGVEVKGNWPGLNRKGYNDGIQITTDYRLILAEALNKRMGATAAQINNSVFPGLAYAPAGSLNIFA